MTLNIKLNRESVAMAVGILVLAVVFVMLMWFPSAFFSFVATLAWVLLVLAASAVIAVVVMLGVYNLLGKFVSDDEEDTDDEE